MLCCCEGMNDVTIGSLSYEFRKGFYKNTVVVGYVNMGYYNGSFLDTLEWQDIFFKHMERGLTVKTSFNIACKYMPKLKNHVRFSGDPFLRIKQIGKENPDNYLEKTIQNPLFYYLLEFLMNQFHFFRK